MLCNVDYPFAKFPTFSGCNTDINHQTKGHIAAAVQTFCSNFVPLKDYYVTDI